MFFNEAKAEIIKTLRNGEKNVQEMYYMLPACEHDDPVVVAVCQGVKNRSDIGQACLSHGISGRDDGGGQTQFCGNA